MNPRSISQARQAAQAKRASLVDAATVANEVLFAHSDTVDALNSIMRHPRSLNRDIANWRPPIKQLPGVIDHGDLTASISRFRVGPRAISRIHGYGERRKPAYLIRLRITDPAGLEVRPELPKAGCVPLSHHIPLLRCMRSLLDKPQLLYGWWTGITSHCAPRVQCSPASTKRLR